MYNSSTVCIIVLNAEVIFLQYPASPKGDQSEGGRPICDEVCIEISAMRNKILFKNYISMLILIMYIKFYNYTTECARL